MDFKLIAPRKVGTTGLTQVLLNRGFSEKEIGHFLNTTDEDMQVDFNEYNIIK